MNVLDMKKINEKLGEIKVMTWRCSRYSEEAAPNYIFKFNQIVVIYWYTEDAQKRQILSKILNCSYKEIYFCWYPKRHCYRYTRILLSWQCCNYCNNLNYIKKHFETTKWYVLLQNWVGYDILTFSHHSSL